MESKITIGGQALIEGVMMRSTTKYALCVRKPNRKISTKIIKVRNSWLAKVPIIRGCYRFIETIYIGVKAISYSATESSGEDEKLNNGEIIITLLFSFGIFFLLFYLLPLLLARVLTQNKGTFFNLIDGIARLIIFFAYLVVISAFSDIKKVFQYHGAEHMTVLCYENNENLTVKNIKKFSTLHPRCGTNFILIVFVVSIFIFSFIPVKTLFYRFGMRLVLLPLIAGISYEILRFAGKHYDNILVKILIFPGILMQKITTKKPKDYMIKVAIKALKAAIS
jgi:uncharacterized protein YqhQ